MLFQRNKVQKIWKQCCKRKLLFMMILCLLMLQLPWIQKMIFEIRTALISYNVKGMDYRLGQKLKKEVLEQKYQRTNEACTITETSSANSYRERASGVEVSALYSGGGEYISYIGVKEIKESKVPTCRIAEVAGMGEFEIFGITYGTLLNEAETKLQRYGFKKKWGG